MAIEQTALEQLLGAAETLAAHAEEMYPHFESERGQEDIARVKQAILRIRKLPPDRVCACGLCAVGQEA